MVIMDPISIFTDLASVIDSICESNLCIVTTCTIPSAFNGGWIMLFRFFFVFFVFFFIFSPRNTIAFPTETIPID